MRRLRSLRARLTLAFSVLTCLAVGALAYAMSELVDRAVWAPLDAELLEEAETLCTLLATGSVADLERTASAFAREPRPGPGKFVRVMRPDRTVVVDAGRIPGRIRHWAHPARMRTRTVQVHRSPQPYRVVWFQEGGRCRSVVGVRAGRYVATVRQARGLIATGGIGLLIALGAVAWGVTTRATAELHRLAREVETIEASALHRRLVPRRTSEVDALTTVLNRLLARLEAAVGHLRRFTADAAHELRTPIAALRARLEVTIGGERTLGAYHDGLVDALEQTERLGRLAEMLLTLSAVESGTVATQFETVRLDTLVREVADSLRPLAEDGARPLACDTAGPVAVRGEPHLLKRVALNLLDNALRHTPPATPVRIGVRTEDGSAILEVHDEGPGIPPDERARVFDRFHRGGRSGTGSGLGLALSREIVLHHGGELRLDESPGAGTTMIVRLPLASADA